VSRFRFSAALSLSCLLVVVMGMTLVPMGCCQQEADPTWYDPRPSANKDVAHPPHLEQPNRRNRHQVPRCSRNANIRKASNQSIAPGATATMRLASQLSPEMILRRHSRKANRFLKFNFPQIDSLKERTL
jgi:hypothetical protein